MVTIPLSFRKGVLRLLLANVIAHLVLFCPPLLYNGADHPLEWVMLAVPLLMILHHVMRLWKRTYWLVICEVIVSFVELIAVIIVFLLPIAGVLLDPSDSLNQAERFEVPIYLIYLGIFGIIACLSFITFIILLCDVIHSRGKTLRSPYRFSAESDQPGRQWAVIFGRSVVRKRFNTDNVFVRCLRGGLALICVFTMLLLVLYHTVFQPLYLSGSPGIQIFKIPVSAGDFNRTLRSIIEEERNLGVRAILPIPSTSTTAQSPSMKINLTYAFPNTKVRSDAYDCMNDTLPQAVGIYCPIVMLPSNYNDVLELLFTVSFSGLLDDLQVYLGVAGLAEDILAHAEPISLGPGSNLHGLSLVTVKKMLSDRNTATLGAPQYRYFAVLDVRSLAPDWSRSLVGDNDTATLRVTVRAQREIPVERQFLEGSVISGFAVVGGVWTLINGVFAAIFGSGILLVLFGTKPLSIHGLIHLVRPGKAALEHGDSGLSAEEQGRIVGILQEHLMDVGEKKDVEDADHITTR